MKTLLLMRHAKSDWDADYGPDHDRPLNERGLRSARLMGRVLAEEGLVPDLHHQLYGGAGQEDCRAGWRSGQMGERDHARPITV